MKFKDLLSQEQPFFIVSLSFIWQALFFYIPLLFIVIQSFFRIVDTYQYEFSLSNFTNFFSPTYFLIIFKSIGLALITVFLCFVLGYPIAYFLAFKSGKYKNIFLFLLILPFWTNFLLHVYAWFYVLEKTGFLNNFLIYLKLIDKPISLLNSFWAVVAVMAYCYLPFMVTPIYSILERVDKNILEASADLGASIWHTWTKIIFPLSITGVLSGFFLVFVPAFGEFAIPGLIGGEKFVFVGTAITQYILAPKTMSLGAAFTIISCAVLILFMVGAYFLWKRNFSNLIKI